MLALRMEELESELLSTRNALQLSREDRQAAMEEFRAANEELLATNDELQIANEKLVSIISEVNRTNTEYQRLSIEHDNMLNSIDSGMIFVDKKLRIRGFNPAIASFFTLIPRDIGRPIDDIVCRLADRETMRADIQQVLADAACIEKEVVGPDGKWLLVRSMPFKSKTGEVEGVVITLTDISKTKEAEQTVNRLNEELTRTNDRLEARVAERTGDLEKSRGELRSLAIALSLVEEKERRRLATELHDEIGQNLAFATITLGDFSCKRPSARCAESITEIRALLKLTIQEVRSLTFQISPPLLHEVGLEAAVDWLAEEFENKYRLRIVVDNDDNSSQKLNEELSSTLYHVVRELLVNVVKHAQAKNVSITLRRDSNHMKIVVADSGCGFDVLLPGRNKEKVDGFGLFNIRQRIQHMGGSLDVVSEIGHGTQVKIKVLLEWPAAPRAKVAI